MRAANIDPGPGFYRSLFPSTLIVKPFSVWAVHFKRTVNAAAFLHMAGNYRYSCFLSYRHSDNLPAGVDRPGGRQWANWLHHLLETYQIPRSLQRHVLANNDTSGSSLYPVFQDEKELPADADLETPIRAAIEASRTMLIICSPDAVKSRFVAEEILHFKRLGRSAQILAIIIAGEPNADDPGKLKHRITPDDECFPLPLRHPILPDGTLDLKQRVEPLAADARINSLEEGYTTAAAYREALITSGTFSASEIKRRVSDYHSKLELAKIKVIAGVIGVPLGELTQRDAARQAETLRKRTFWIFLICIVQSLILLWALLEHYRAESAIRDWKNALVERGKAEHLLEALSAQLNSKNLSDKEKHELERQVGSVRQTIGVLEGKVSDRLFGSLFSIIGHWTVSDSRLSGPIESITLSQGFQYKGGSWGRDFGGPNGIGANQYRYENVSGRRTTS